MGEKVAEFYEVTIDGEIEHGGTCVHPILMISVAVLSVALRNS
jgi:hypothetical protein